MDGKDGLDVFVQLELAVLYIEHGRDQAGLPVVAMQHIRHKVNQRQAFEHRTAEIGEPLALVRAIAIDIVAAEILLVVDEVEGNPVVDELFNAHVLPAPAEVDVEKQHMFHLLAPFGFDGGVHGQHHAHVYPLIAQALGQRAHHVRQTAGLDKRYAFARGKQNLHWETPFTE